MKLHWLPLVATLALSSLAHAETPATQWLSDASQDQTWPKSSARLGGAAEASDPLVGLLATGFFSPLAASPLYPLDEGGGVSSSQRPLISLLLSLLIGFGTGHLIAGDNDGFVLWLIVDVVIVVASSLLHAVVQGGLFYPLGSVALLISHIIQGLDSYQKAGGGRLVERARAEAVLVARHQAPSLGTPTHRTFAFSF